MEKDLQSQVSSACESAEKFLDKIPGPKLLKIAAIAGAAVALPTLTAVVATGSLAAYLYKEMKESKNEKSGSQPNRPLP